MGAATRMRLAEPVHLGWKIWRIEIAKATNRLKARSRLLEIANADQDVGDRLGFQARHGSAADVMDAADDPLAYGLCKGRPLFLESRRPDCVVRGKPNRLVGRPRLRRWLR